MREKASLALLLLFLIPACNRGTGPTAVGDDVGRYQVQASLMSNECGEGHPAPPTLGFVVDLGHLPGSSRGYWKLPDGPQIDGTLERSRDFRFEQSRQIVVIPRDMSMGIPGCVIERRETVTGTLQALRIEAPDGSVPDAGSEDAGSEDAGVVDASPPAPTPQDNESAFSGTTMVYVSAVPGGNCTALLAVYGGPFPTVPCAIEYELTGVRVDAP